MQFEHHNQIQKMVQKRTTILQKLNDLSLENHEDITSFLTFLNSNLVDFDAYDLVTFYLFKQAEFVQFSSKVKSIKRVEKTYQELHIFDREIAYFDKHSFSYHESLNTSEILIDQMGIIFDHTCTNQAFDIPIFKMNSIIGIIRFEASIKPFTDTFMWLISSLFEHYRHNQFKQLLDINHQDLFVNELFHQTLLEKNKIAFFTYDINQKVTHFEKGSFRLFGLDSDDQLTKEFMISHIHPDDIHKVTLTTLDTIQSKKSNTIVYRIQVNQQDHWFLSYQMYTTIKQNGYLIGFIEDISDPLAKVEHFMDYQSYTDTLSMMRIKELEKEVQSNQLLLESKNKFISNMSHEIRTPMNSIIGFTELMKTLNLKDEEKEYVDRIYDASKHLLSIVNDILDLSKLEAGKIVIEKIPFQLTSLLNSVKVIFADILKQKKLYLDIETIHCPNYITGDENRIRQILILEFDANLVLSLLKCPIHISFFHGLIVFLLGKYSFFQNIQSYFHHYL
jgi:PAS domain-containing protein